MIAKLPTALLASPLVGWALVGVSLASTAPQDALKRPKLDGSRWFAELVPKATGKTSEAAVPTKLAVTLQFAGSEVEITGASQPIATAEFRLERRGSRWHLSAEHGSDDQTGQFVWDANLSRSSASTAAGSNQLKGTATWQVTPETTIEYELRGRIATPLDGSQWKVTLTSTATPEPTDKGETEGKRESETEGKSEAPSKGKSKAAPVTIAGTAEFERGRVRIVTADAKPSLLWTDYRLNDDSTPWTVRAGKAPAASIAIDATVYQFEIRDSKLTGTVMHYGKGQELGRYNVQGERIAR